MARVSDEQLGRIARLQADIFRRVRDGVIDVKTVSEKLKDIIEDKSSRINKYYLVTVDYSLSIEKAIKLGRYDWSDTAINFERFPTDRSGIAEIVVELIYFISYKNLSADAVVGELKQMGYRPAELHELLALGAQYPEVQRVELPIAALGSIWERRDTRFCVQLCLFGSDRHAAFIWLGDIPRTSCCFAAVHM